MNKQVHFRRKIYEIGGIKTSVYLEGEGPPLLWLHGAGGLNPQLPFFKALAQRYSLYLVDHPGFGHSERPKWLDSIQDYPYFYRDLLNFFELEQVIVAGHSLGGHIAVELAISHPHRVSKLILFCPAGLYLEEAKRPDTFMMSQEESKRLLFYDQRYAKEMLTSFQSPQAQEIAVKNLTTVALLYWSRNYNPKLPRLLRYIEALTCLIWGREDQIIPLAYGEAYRKHIAGAQLHVLERCGHMPFIEQEETCLQLIDQFIGQ
jgi:pimeloyl-ACP methyl ester carboxylesterase